MDTVGPLKKEALLITQILDEKMGTISPRAKYDPDTEPGPKYFKEILENNLSEVEIREFCEDFLKLLNFNNKFLKDKVPCLIGDANKGKTSLFHSILMTVHHTNIATTTKQRAFNKVMISKFIEVIFFDEAFTSTMDIVPRFTNTPTMAQTMPSVPISQPQAFDICLFFTGEPKFPTAGQPDLYKGLPSIIK